uniref:G_PROTEIN_RECEP_F1_2 domain-containing protein n=1 Tax=Parastrongyloides trichosuri TaxID=131310 RepID=A0A0N4Z842_PARTI
MAFNKGLAFFICALIIIIICSIVGNVLYFTNYNEEPFCFSQAYHTSTGNAGIYLLHIGNCLSIIFFIVCIISAFAYSRYKEFSIILFVLIFLRICVDVVGIILLSIALTDQNCHSTKAIVGLAINLAGIFIVLAFVCLSWRSRSNDSEYVY